MSSKMRCAIIGCANIKSKGIEKPSEKYFFCCPRKEQRKQLWMEATGRSGSKFYVCEDHFDVSSIHFLTLCVSLAVITTNISQLFFFKLFR